jgi:hypothetical protein
MKFKNWIIEEAISISPSIKGFALKVNQKGNALEYADEKKLKSFLKNSIQKYYGDEFEALSSRYEIELSEIFEGNSEVFFTILLKPKKFREPELVSPDNDLYDYYKKYKGGKTGYYLKKNPEDAIKEIPDNPNLVYRGMSFEEWENIKKTGFIQSKGSYNIGDDQKGLTFYGKASTASSYASGFSPWQFETSRNKPSVVIAISKNNVKSHEDMPEAIPPSEYAHVGPLSAKEILEAWMVVATRASFGTLTLIFQYDYNKNGYFELSGPKREGARFTPNIRYVLKKII